MNVVTGFTDIIRKGSPMMPMEASIGSSVPLVASTSTNSPASSPHSPATMTRTPSSRFPRLSDGAGRSDSAERGTRPFGLATNWRRKRVMIKRRRRSPGRRRAHRPTNIRIKWRTNRAKDPDVDDDDYHAQEDDDDIEDDIHNNDVSYNAASDARTLSTATGYESDDGYSDTSDYSGYGASSDGGGGGGGMREKLRVKVPRPKFAEDDFVPAVRSTCEIWLGNRKRKGVENPIRIAENHYWTNNASDNASDITMALR